MWKKTETSIKKIKYIIYTNSNNQKIKEFLFFKPNYNNEPKDNSESKDNNQPNDNSEPKDNYKPKYNYLKCIINFSSTDEADCFFEKFTSVSPVYMDTPRLVINSEDIDYSSYKEEDTDYYSHKEEELELTCVRINLSEQTESDLEEICKHLLTLDYNIPDDILKIIQSMPRPLSFLEDKFSKELSKLNEENFASLLEMAVQISFKLQNANDLWKLANFAENKLNPPSIDKCIKSLTCIRPGLNYYYKALSKLTCFALIKLSDPEISIESQKEWVKKGLFWAFNIPNGGIDIAKKIALSLLNKNLVDNTEIFSCIKVKEDAYYMDKEHLEYIVNLLMHIKYLHQENAYLKQRNDNYRFNLLNCSKYSIKNQVKSEQEFKQTQTEQDPDFSQQQVTQEPDFSQQQIRQRQDLTQEQVIQAQVTQAQATPEQVEQDLNQSKNNYNLSSMKLKS